jgi:hypothetical protein
MREFEITFMTDGGNVCWSKIDAETEEEALEIFWQDQMGNYSSGACNKIINIT